MSNPVRLVMAAEDAEDLEVVSARVQDAVLRVADMAYEPTTRRFALMMSRFMWEDAPEKGAAKPSKGPYRRIRSALHFEGVLKVRHRNIRMGDGEAFLSLLAIRFEPGNGQDADDPSGEICMTFSGDGEVRIEAECLDAHLRDLGEPWTTTRLPVHALSEE